MNKLKRLLKRLLIYQIPLLLTYVALTQLSSLISGMVWTRFYVDYSYMLAHLVKCLRFAGEAAGFLWIAFCVKHLVRRLQIRLSSKPTDVLAQEEKAVNAKRKKLLRFMRFFQHNKAIDFITSALKRFKGRETLFKILYWLMDLAITGLWVYLAVKFIFEVEKSSSPVNLGKVFQREGTFPYTFLHLLPVLGLGLVAGAVIYLTRKNKGTLMCILQPLVGYAFFDTACIVSLMLFKKDITVYTEWLVTATTALLIANITTGILRQFKHLGRINFAKLHPLFPRKKKEEPDTDEDDEAMEAAPEISAAVAAVAAAEAAAAAAPAPEASESPKASEPPAAPAPVPVAAEKTASEEAPKAPVKEAPLPPQEETLPVEKEPAAPATKQAAAPIAIEKKPAAPEKAAQPPAPGQKKKRVKKSFRERTGLSFKSLWTIHFMIGMIPYCILLIFFVIVLSTTMYTINPNEQALVYRFGLLREESVTDPGLHFKLPYPFDQVEIYDVTRMKSMFVGYTPSESNDYLWTSEHGGEEYTLLLGNGNELVAVNMRLNYWIDNLMNYRTIYENPESMLNARAFAVMMERTMSSDLNTVLSVDRSTLADEVKDELNAFADEKKLGLEVANVIIENIHPPVEVAEVYQSVINASIQKVTQTKAAESYAYQTLSAAQQQHTAAVAAATKNQTSRLAGAKSEIDVFQAACQEYLLSPNSYKLWKVTNAYGQLVQKSRIYVFSPGTEKIMNRFLLKNGQNVPLIGQ